MSDPASASTTTTLSTKFAWLPDRKVYAGGLGGILAWLLLAACSSWLHFDLASYLQPIVTACAAAFSIDPAPSAQGALAILFGLGVGYLVPPSAHDIYTKLNNRLVALGIADPKVPVTRTGIAVEANKIDLPPDAGTTGLYLRKPPE